MIDLHMHSSCSDGNDNVEELLKNVHKAGVKYFSITDHDTAESGRLIFADKNLQDFIHKNELVYTTGIELSCKYKGHKMHILAYDFDPNAPEVFELEQKYKELLKQKAEEKIELLNNAGYVFSEKSLEYLKTRINIRTLDLANCLVDDGYFDDLQKSANYVSKGLKTSVPSRLEAEFVLPLMKNIGAKLVWAHPIYGVGDKPESFEDIFWLAEELKQFGLVGLECFYSLYDKDQIDELLKIAKSLDLIVTTGSDYHGKNKSVRLAERTADGSEVEESKIKLDKIFVNNVICEKGGYGEIFYR